MLFLTRLLMPSKLLSNPTIVLIINRTDLDDQLAEQITNAKEFIGDNQVSHPVSKSDSYWVWKGESLKSSHPMRDGSLNLVYIFYLLLRTRRASYRT